MGKSLHTSIEPLGKTIYQIIGLLYALEDKPNLNFGYVIADQISAQQFSDCMQLLADIAEIVKENGWLSNSPWKGCNVKQLSLKFKSEFNERAATLIKLTVAVKTIVFELYNNLNIRSTFNNNDIIEVDELFKLFSKRRAIPRGWICEEIINAVVLFDTWDKESSAVEKNFKKSVYNFNADKFLENSKGKYKSTFRIFKSSYRNDMKELSSHLNNSSKKLKYNDALVKVSEIVNAKKVHTSLTKLLREISDPDAFTEIDEITKKRVDNAAMIYKFANKNRVPLSIIDKLLAWDANSTAEYERMWHTLHDLLIDYNKELKYFLSMFSNPDEIMSMDLDCFLEKVDGCNSNIKGLEVYNDFLEYLEKCERLQITNFIKLAEEANLDIEQLVNAFLKCFCRSWLDLVMPKYKAIDTFRGSRHDSRIDKFRKLDIDHLEIAKSKVYASLLSKLPDTSLYSTGEDEMSILKKEITKKRKLLPPRKLFEAIPNLLTLLKPCLMMSPLTVSTLLKPNFYFDTLIFDEASQIRTEDAICAIYRSKQVIITGDTKQLPPTDFFTTSYTNDDPNDEDEYSDLGAYDSLLEEAAPFLRSKTLQWHYRSKHEHLIAFSNAKIYNNSLITFPSSIEIAEDMGVQYVYVRDGIYNRGGKNGNLREAEVVANMVFEHFRRTPKRSLGIIAFGEVQQQAITSALERRRKSNLEFEEFFRENRNEALFIKNLETVQGDERDTIFFSIGYARDEAGRFSMHFGPLSRSGGERRLNVAVTRARYNLKLVGSIQPTDIDIDRAKSEGARLLRAYIDFAINGPKTILGEVVSSESQIFDSTFEEYIANYLESCGYKVVTQVGRSGYRIDLAVKDPNRNGRFAIGIECDGTNYHSARMARERDRLRQTVLEDMGWIIYRIWSTDWIKDPLSEKDKLRKAIDDAINRISVDEKIERADKRENEITNYVVVNELGNKLKESILSEYYNYNAVDVPISDLKKTICMLLSNYYGITKEGLVKALLKSYGWQKRGKVINERFNEAFKSLCNTKHIRVFDGKVELIKKEQIK